MKYGALTLTAVAILALAGLTALAQGIGDIKGFANASTYIHAGPGQDFPVVAHIPPGADMTIAGCTNGFIWCDVAWNGNRGWIAGRFLDSEFNSQHVNVAEFGHAINLPTVVFDQRNYWRRNYRTYPFYASPTYWTMMPAQTPAEVRSERYAPVDE
jgi:uncharacterized protein YraI